MPRRQFTFRPQHGDTAIVLSIVLLASVACWGLHHMASAVVPHVAVYGVEADSNESQESQRSLNRAAAKGAIESKEIAQQAREAGVAISLVTAGEQVTLGAAYQGNNPAGPAAAKALAERLAEAYQAETVAIALKLANEKSNAAYQQQVAAVDRLRSQTQATDALYEVDVRLHDLKLQQQAAGDFRRQQLAKREKAKQAAAKPLASSIEPFDAEPDFVPVLAGPNGPLEVSQAIRNPFFTATERVEPNPQAPSADVHAPSEEEIEAAMLAMEVDRSSALLQQLMAADSSRPEALQRSELLQRRAELLATLRPTAKTTEKTTAMTRQQSIAPSYATAHVRLLAETNRSWAPVAKLASQVLLLLVLATGVVRVLLRSRENVATQDTASMLSFGMSARTIQPTSTLQTSTLPMSEKRELAPQQSIEPTELPAAA